MVDDDNSTRFDERLVANTGCRGFLVMRKEETPYATSCACHWSLRWGTHRSPIICRAALKFSEAGHLAQLGLALVAADNICNKTTPHAWRSLMACCNEARPTSPIPAAVISLVSQAVPSLAQCARLRADIQKRWAHPVPS